MDDEKGSQGTSSREWEVVSLTASTYAAAPGPETLQSNDSHGNMLDTDDDEISRAMFMSGHFVFPPSQHENLPLDIDETHNNPEDEVESPTERSEERDKISLDRASESEEASNFSSIPSEADISGSNVSHENFIIPESSESLESNQESPLDSTVQSNENKFNESGLPCEAWWKKRAASLFAQAKEANAVWSVFVAAALMGLVILGQRWQSQHLKWQAIINDEKMNRILGPISRIKYVFVNSHRPGSLLKGSVTMDH